MAAISEPLERRRLLDGILPAQPVNAITIDLLAVYTAGAKSHYGNSDAQITTAIQRSVDAMNQAMDNSAIAITVRLVHAEQVSYVGTGDLYLDRTRLRTPGDGYMDTVHALRNTWGADLVTAIVDAGSGGNGDLMTSIGDPNNSTYAFSAIAWDAIGPDNLTLAHELGHNLGAGHERNNPTQPAVGPFSYSYGYRFTANSLLYHDIMSYDPGIGLPYYANPAISYRGAATGSNVGNADEADLAKTFEVTAPIVAAYRTSAVMDTTLPVAGLREVHCDGALLTFTVRYTDDSGIDLSTLDSNDISVTVPDGFVLSAGLLSVQHPNVGGGVKLATYRVMLPANLPAVDSLVFSLKSNAIKDIRGNFAAAGAINAFQPDNQYPWLSTAHDLGALNEQVTSGGVLERGHNEQTFRFTLASTQTLSIKMSNLLADANIFVVHDDNNNDVFDGGAEGGAGSFLTGTSDESFTVTLAAGTYYLFVYNFTPDVSNHFNLSVTRYTDNTPPTAALDATDVTTTGNADFLFRVAYRDDREMDAVTTRYYTPIRLTNPFGGYYIYFPESVDTNVNSQTIWATYRISYNGGGFITAGDNGTYTVSVEPQNSPIWGVNPLNDFVHDGAGNKLIPATLGAFKVAIGLPDTTLPTAAANASNVVVGNVPGYDFTVTYKDNVAINGTTVDGNDVRVTGPNAFNQPASFVSLSPAIPGSGQRIATYHIAAPDGLWDFADNGNYSIVMQSAQVKDSSNNSVASGVIGAFSVHVFLPGDATLNNKVDTLDFNILAANFALRGRGFAEGDFNYDGAVDSADFNLLSGNHGKSIPAAAPAAALFSPFGKEDAPDDWLP